MSICSTNIVYTDSNRSSRPKMTPHLLKPLFMFLMTVHLSIQMDDLLYPHVKKCEPQEMGDSKVQWLPYETREETKTGWRCLSAYHWINVKEECQVGIKCRDGTVIRREPGTCIAVPNLHCDEVVNATSEKVIAWNSDLTKGADLTMVNNDYGDICEIEGIKVKDCDDWQDVFRDYYIATDDQGNVKCLRNPSIIEEELAESIEAYKCTGTCDKVDCKLGECSGDERYIQNFQGTALSTCNCSYDARHTRTTLRINNRFVVPRILMSFRTKVKLYKAPVLSKEYGCKKCSATCTNTGLVINTGLIHADHYMVCGNPRCVAGVADGNEIEVRIPRDMVVHGGERKIEIWQKGSQKKHEFTVGCSSRDECDTIDCIFCKDFWTTVNCYGPVHWIVVGFLTSIGVILFGALMKGIKAIIFTVGILILPIRWLYVMVRWLPNCKKVRSAFYKKSDSDIESQKPQLSSVRARDLVRAALMGNNILLMFCLFLVADGCAASTSMQSQGRACYLENSKEICSITGQLRLSLSPIGQSSCFRLYDANEKPLGGFTIKTEKIQLSCMKEFQYYVPRATAKCISHKRCRGAGDCTGDVCETYPEASGSEYWNQDIMSHKGSSSCTRVPGCAGSGCGLCADACLWYRWYLENPSDEYYEVVDCPQWTYSVHIEITRGEGMDLKQESVILIAGEPKNVLDSVISLVSISSPPQPILGKCVMIASDGRSGLIECNRRTELVEGKIGEINCPDKQSAIKLDSRCNSVIGAVKVNVQSDSVTCSSKIVDPRKAIADSPLPQMMDGLAIYSDHTGIHAQLNHNAMLELQIDLENAHFSVQTDRSLCSVSFVNISGCYECSTGAKVTLKGHTNEGTAVSYIDCEGDGNMWKTQLRLQESAKVHELIMHVDKPNIDMSCTVDCPGGKSKFRMAGKLIKVGWQDDTTSNRTTGIESGKDDKGISWDNILNASWFNTWWKKLLVIGGTILMIIAFIWIFSLLISCCKRK